MSAGWLGSFPAFAGLSEADRTLLERVIVVHRAQPGHVFVREGDRAAGVTAAMFFLIEGQVSVSTGAPTGGFGVSRTLGPGAAFGTVALVADVPRTATCTAATVCTYGALDRRVFSELFRREVGLHARFQLAIARSLAADLRALRALLVDAIARGSDDQLRKRYGAG